MNGKSRPLFIVHYPHWTNASTAIPLKTQSSLVFILKLLKSLILAVLESSRYCLVEIMTTTVRIHTAAHPAMDIQVSMVQVVVVLLALVALAPRAAAIVAIALFYCSNHQSSVDGSQPSTKSDEVPKGKASVMLEPENSSVTPQESETTNEVCISLI